MQREQMCLVLSHSNSRQSISIKLIFQSNNHIISKKACYTIKGKMMNGDSSVRGSKPCPGVIDQQAATGAP